MIKETYLKRSELATTLSSELYTAHCEKRVYGNDVVFDFAAWIDGNSYTLTINGNEPIHIIKGTCWFKDVNEALRLANKTIREYLQYLYD